MASDYYYAPTLPLAAADRHSIDIIFSNPPVEVWQHEATRIADNARLYTAVDYSERADGRWYAVLVHSDGHVEKLKRVPPIRIVSFKPTFTLTSHGYDIRKKGRKA